MPTEDIMLTDSGVQNILQTVAEVAYSDTLNVPLHKTAAEYSVSDHIIQNPVTVSLKLTVLKEEIEALRALKDQKKKLKFISETRVLENIVISAMNYTEGSSITACSMTLKLQEIITAKVESASESLDILQGKSEGSVTALNVAATPEDIKRDVEELNEIVGKEVTIRGMAG
ncbi:MAG: hypothetical protein JXQ82_07655 [Methanomicrobiaceae archaeon]|nr:hypothetical protein [Methanomicrobiaceae archaeon]